MSYFDSQQFKDRLEKSKLEKFKASREARAKCEHHNKKLYRGSNVYCFCNFLKAQGWENIPITCDECFLHRRSKDRLTKMLISINEQKQKEKNVPKNSL